MKILHKICKFRTHIILWATAVLLVTASLVSFNIEYNQINDFLNTESEKILIRCQVVSYPVFKEQTVSFCAKVTECEESRLDDKKLYVTLSMDIPSAKFLSYHDEIRFYSGAEAASPRRNPGGFSFESYIKGMGCVGNVYISKKDFKSMSAGSRNEIYKFRQRFIGAVDKYFNPTDGAMIKAIVCGNRDEMNEEVSQSLKMSGVYHIVAISGLHLNLFTCVVAYLIGRLRIKRFKKALLSFGGCLIVSVMVLVFTGFGISVWRAFIMMLVFCFSAIASRDYSAKNSLFVSAFIILMTMPCSFWSISFQLSFLSTFAVLVSIDVISYLRERGFEKSVLYSAIVQTIIVSVLAIVFTIPVTVNAFGYVTLYSWLANLLILPIMPYLLASGVMFAFVSSIGIEWASKLLSYAATSFSRAVIIIAQKVSVLPFSTVETNAGSVIMTAFFILSVGIIFFFLHKKDLKKCFCAFLIFGVAWSGFLVYNSRDDKITVTFADVGQGDAAIIQTNDECIIIDCGTTSSSSHTISEILGILRTGGSESVDAIVVSHYHTDHTNIIPSLIESGAVEHLVMPRYYDFTELEAKNIKHILTSEALRYGTKIFYASEGSRFSVGDNISLEFLSPSDDMFEENNEMSAVVKLTYGNNRVLFCGDIEKAGMENLLDKDIDCDVVKVAHHGGRCEITQDFLKSVSPEYAIISCGENNSYKHPHPDTIESLENQGCEILRTDKSGAITLVADKEKILEIKTMR